jgi:hypothetical protein
VSPGLFYLGEWKCGIETTSKKCCLHYYIFDVYNNNKQVFSFSFSNGSGREKEKKRNVEKSERRKIDLAKENRDLR